MCSENGAGNDKRGGVKGKKSKTRKNMPNFRIEALSTGTIPHSREDPSHAPAYVPGTPNLNHGVTFGDIWSRRKIRLSRSLCLGHIPYHPCITDAGLVLQDALNSTCRILSPNHTCLVRHVSIKKKEREWQLDNRACHSDLCRYLHPVYPIGYYTTQDLLSSQPRYLHPI